VEITVLQCSVSYKVRYTLSEFCGENIAVLRVHNNGMTSLPVGSACNLASSPSRAF
jgi:hypothetical protein